MQLRLGDEAPDFRANTTVGPIHFYEWMSDQWVMLFSHPKDFTPVCTTELGYLARLQPEFVKRGCKIIGLSIDTVDDHHRWARDIEETQGTALNYPLIGDTDLAVAKLYDMIHPNANGDAKSRTAQDNSTVRSVFLIGPDRRIKLMLTYPMSTGRNFDELLRALDACQLTAEFKVATPANWRPGEKVIIVPSVADEEARRMFPAGWQSPRPYIRLVDSPHH